MSKFPWYCQGKCQFRLKDVTCGTHSECDFFLRKKILLISPGFCCFTGRAPIDNGVNDETELNLHYFHVLELFSLFLYAEMREKSLSECSDSLWIGNNA